MVYTISKIDQTCPIGNPITDIYYFTELKIDFFGQKLDMSTKRYIFVLSR